MGLQDFDIAPDNNGGRPSKPDDEREMVYEARDLLYKPQRLFTVDKNTREWWQSLWDDYVEGDEPTNKEMEQMCRDTALLPISIKGHLHDYGIKVFDEINERERELKPTSRFGGRASKLDGASGLQALINAEK